MKTIQYKKLCSAAAGSLPDTGNLKGAIAEAKAIRNKFRSPFGFVGPKRTVAKIGLRYER